jgi:hypothetical protein
MSNKLCGTAIAALLVLVAGGARAEKCKPGNGITYTCDLSCAMPVCDISSIGHVACDAFGALHGKCVICGRSGADTITGTDGEDVICGNGGAIRSRAVGATT